MAQVDSQGTKSRRNCKVPFVRGGFKNAAHALVAFLGFVGSAIVSKVSGWKDLGGALDDDVAIFTRGDLPLERAGERQTNGAHWKAAYYLLVWSATGRENGDKAVIHAG